MKLTVTDSNNPPKNKPPCTAAGRTEYDFTDQWFERDKLIAGIKFLLDPAQEFIELSKIFAAINSSTLHDEEEPAPSRPVVLEDTPAMQELDQILQQYSAQKSSQNPLN